MTCTSDQTREHRLNDHVAPVGTHPRCVRHSDTRCARPYHANQPDLLLVGRKTKTSSDASQKAPERARKDTSKEAGGVLRDATLLMPGVYPFFEHGNAPHLWKQRLRRVSGSGFPRNPSWGGYPSSRSRRSAKPGRSGQGVGSGFAATVSAAVRIHFPKRVNARFRPSAMA